jgi:hypothetical protein
MSATKPSASTALDVVAVVADGVTLVRRNAGVLVCVLAPSLALSVALPWAVSLGVTHAVPPAANGALPAAAGSGAMLVLAVLLAIAVPWALGALAAIRVCLDDLAGRKPDAKAALATAAQRLPAATGLVLLTTLGITAGALLFIWPALYLAVIWSLAMVVLAAEDLGVWQALRRSAALVAGMGWRVFALLIGWGAFAAAASLTAEAVMGPDSLAPLVVPLLASTLWSVLAAALYGRRTGLTPLPLRPSARFAPAARA